ncbi:MAG: hypothetical protein QXN08_05360 [Nitrososphaerales archaeon]
MLREAAVGRFKFYSALSYVLWAKENGQSESLIDVERDLAAVEITSQSIKEFLVKDRKIPLVRECVSRFPEDYAKMLTNFYSENGFEASTIQPDHPAAMLAFTASLIFKEVEDSKNVVKYWRVEHRFIKTYLMEALLCLRSRIPSTFTQAIVEAVSIDLSLLYEALKNVSSDSDDASMVH